MTHSLSRPRPGAVVMLLIAALGAFAVGGCSSKFPEVDRDLKGATAEFDVPAKQLVEKIRALLSTPPNDIGITEQDKGSILTGYQRFPGEWRIGRRWQEQTRYRITVIPDWDAPDLRSTIEVREITEQRAAEGMKWEPAPDISRPERSLALLEQIRQQVK